MTFVIFFLSLGDFPVLIKFMISLWVFETLLSSPHELALG